MSESSDEDDAMTDAMQTSERLSQPDPLWSKIGLIILLIFLAFLLCMAGWSIGLILLNGAPQ